MLQWESVKARYILRLLQLKWKPTGAQWCIKQPESHLDRLLRLLCGNTSHRSWCVAADATASGDDEAYTGWFFKQFSTKMKKGNQSTRGSLRWRISWNNSSGWLIDIFQFGTEQGGPVKRSPCIWYWWWKCYRSSTTNFALSIFRCFSSNNITSKDKQGLALCSPKGWQKFHSWTEEIRKYFH